MERETAEEEEGGEEKEEGLFPESNHSNNHNNNSNNSEEEDEEEDGSEVSSDGSSSRNNNNHNNPRSLIHQVTDVLEKLMAMQPLPITKLQLCLDKLTLAINQMDDDLQEAKKTALQFQLKFLALLALEREKEGAEEAKTTSAVTPTGLECPGSQEETPGMLPKSCGPRLGPPPPPPPPPPPLMVLEAESGPEPYWFGYNEVQVRIDSGFRWIAESKRLALPSSGTAFEQVGSLLTHLAKSRHLLRFLRTRDAGDRRLLATLLRTVYRRTVELMPEGGVRSRWKQGWETRTAATNGGHFINHHNQEEDHDDNEEEDPEAWQRRLKTLQDFLCEQQVAEFFELEKAKRKRKEEDDLHQDSINEVWAGDAMVDDEQLRQLVPFPAYPRLRSSSDTAPFRCCPFCRLPDHFLLADCQLKKEITCFKCFVTGHAKRYCPRQAELLPQALLFPKLQNFC